MINLFVNCYEETDPTRKKELELCYERNTKNRLLTIYDIDSQERPTFSSIFDTVNQVTDNDDINIVANADIYFDDTVAKCRGMDRMDFYALSRWNVVNKSVELYNHADSQDTWVFRGQCRIREADFKIGLIACDNRLAFEAERAGYRIKNPSLTIKTYHVHESGIRTYSGSKKAQVVPKPYRYIQPTQLQM